MTTSFMSANPPAERPTFVEIGEAVRTSMAALARVLGRAPRCAPIVTLIAFTGHGRGGRNDRHRQQQQHGDGANEQVRTRVYRRAGGHVVDSLRESRVACATFVACEALPTFARSTDVRRRLLGSGRMPSSAVWPAGGYGANCAARRRASARRAASTWAVRAASFWMRPSSLFTRLSAAAKTCLRWTGWSAVPGKLPPRGSALPRRSRCF